MLKTSVALCTFNGARFLAEQLDSIVMQSRIPDEIVLYDDASEDGTVDIARSYQEKLPIQIVVNRQRQGTTRNFSNAIAACTGDIIFLCDQDDIWDAGKVERISACFCRPDRPGMVFSDAILIDQHSRPTGGSLWKTNRFFPRKRERFEQGNAFAHLLRSNIVTGATAAFRREFNKVILPIPQSWIHDYWIATVIASLAPIYSQPAPLTRYRIHSAQQIGLHKNSLSKVMALLAKAKNLSVEYEKYLTLQARIAVSRADLIAPTESVMILNQKLNHIGRRNQIAKDGSSKLATLVGEVFNGNYSRFSYGWVDVLSDVLLITRTGK